MPSFERNSDLILIGLRDRRSTDQLEVYLAVRTVSRGRIKESGRHLLKSRNRNGVAEILREESSSKCMNG